LAGFEVSAEAPDRLIAALKASTVMRTAAAVNP